MEALTSDPGVRCDLCANGSYVLTSDPRDLVGYVNLVPGYKYFCQSFNRPQPAAADGLAA